MNGHLSDLGPDIEAAVLMRSMRLTKIVRHEPAFSDFQAKVEDGMGGADAEIYVDRSSGWVSIRLRQGMRARAEGKAGSRRRVMRPRIEDLFWTTIPFSTHPVCGELAGGFLADAEACLERILGAAAEMCVERPLRTEGRADDRLLRVLADEAWTRFGGVQESALRDTCAPTVTCATLFAPAQSHGFGLFRDHDDREQAFSAAMEGIFARLRPTGWRFPNEDEPWISEPCGFGVGDLPPGWRFDGGFCWSAHEKLEIAALINELILPFPRFS